MPEMCDSTSVVEEKNYLISLHNSVSAELHNIATGVKFVSTPKCGALFTFSGVVRDTDTRYGETSVIEPIKGIYYEGYKPMVMKETEKIVSCVVSGREIKTNSENCMHLTDLESRCWVSICIDCFVPAGMPHVIICLSSQRRDYGHSAIMYLLEEFKIKTPIWKKIVFADDHEEWLQPTKGAF